MAWPYAAALRVPSTGALQRQRQHCRRRELHVPVKALSAQLANSAARVALRTAFRRRAKRSRTETLRHLSVFLPMQRLGRVLEDVVRDLASDVACVVHR